MSKKSADRSEFSEPSSVRRDRVGAAMPWALAPVAVKPCGIPPRPSHDRIRVRRAVTASSAGRSTARRPTRCRRGAGTRQASCRRVNPACSRRRRDHHTDRLKAPVRTSSAMPARHDPRPSRPNWRPHRSARAPTPDRQSALRCRRGWERDDSVASLGAKAVPGDQRLGAAGLVRIVGAAISGGKKASTRR